MHVQALLGASTLQIGCTGSTAYPVDVLVYVRAQVRGHAAYGLLSGSRTTTRRRRPLHPCSPLHFRERPTWCPATPLAPRRFSWETLLVTDAQVCLQCCTLLTSWCGGPTWAARTEVRCSTSAQGLLSGKPCRLSWTCAPSRGSGAPEWVGEWAFPCRAHLPSLVAHLICGECGP